jgi:DNA polymerase-1
MAMATADKKLFLIDGMALVYRAHFAFGKNPIINSRGLNTSALFGFTATLLDIIKAHQPTHLAVAWDTPAPTQRHTEFPEYKAQREAMPDDLVTALPHLRRLVAAFNIPLLAMDGFEADDIIGTLARRAAGENFTTFMVTPDKDFGQLVTENIFIIKLARGGDAPETLGVPEILQRWGIGHPAQVVDVLALMGDASDNIPGVPGIGEKTAAKLIAQYGNVENLLAHTGELTGKLKQNLEAHRADAELSKRLATINCAVPVALTLADMAVRSPDDATLRALFTEFEFTTLGRRVFGADWKLERAPAAPPPAPPTESQADLFG